MTFYATEVTGGIVTFGKSNATEVFVMADKSI